MINKNSYYLLKEKFGDVASWAIWALPGEKPKSNTGDMSVFENEPALLEQLNTHYVFVGLNASEVENGNNSAWSCFHSKSPYQNDFKLRFALIGTDFWGAYITDIIKHFPKTDSGDVKKEIRKTPQLLEKNIKVFIDEIALIGGNPILVAIGDQPYEYLRELEKYGCKHTIMKIPHYAKHISKENYRKQVIENLTP